MFSMLLDVLFFGLFYVPDVVWSVVFMERDHIRCLPKDGIALFV